MERFSKIENAIVDVKKDTITVFLPDQDVDDVVQTLTSDYPFADHEGLRRILEKNLTYSPMMRFVLDDEEKRTFTVERRCFRAGLGDWLPLSYSHNLAKLVKKYCRHLGKESFFELV